MEKFLALKSKTIFSIIGAPKWQKSLICFVNANQMAKLGLLRARKRIDLHVSSKSIHQIIFRSIIRVFVSIEDPIERCPRDECIVDYHWEKNT